MTSSAVGPPHGEPLPSVDSGVFVDAQSWLQRLARDMRRVFVLDDDPTGTRTTSDTDVILVPGPAEYRRFVQDDRRGVHVLTNTRAIEQSVAVDLVRTIEAEASEVGSKNGADAAFVLRSDSTLRGQVFAPESPTATCTFSAGRETTS